MNEIEGRTAVVTGAGGGIGRSIALALADAGANVVVSDIEPEAAAAVAAEVRDRGVRSMMVKTDVSRLDEVEQLAQAAYKQFGAVEILVNNAGVTLRPFRASWDTSYDDFRWVMSVNFWGVLHGHHVFVPRMLQTEGEKHIVNTSSMASLLTVPGHCAYSISKCAVDGLSHCAREELKTQGIGVSILHPGPVRTRIISSERLRTEEDRSEARGVKPWADPTSAAKAEHDVRSVPSQVDPDVASSPMDYITANAIGIKVVAGIRGNIPHILTHPIPVEALQARTNVVIAGLPPHGG
ncbi:SDR family NAD(P)-dependent oxidoreductase [Aromatoleum petrolei]|uniref:SDR family NAD(P)-dependent oxidoreductase n=1 Tax=Aromatoleum petrolei TaxID=76116 RepID=A0ABX1MQM1_9RHOO|nr:SDR family NAD(P)-dependent oxidoreductase [Aromatoleum petrolei]NMF88631.1 SDR family NAD(P)-dependent oxidoreductase [Aromatoleum petrolei]QTQ34658.1 Short-chain dehydrogenase family protein [Aromatoleum petrolei]